MSSGAGAAPKQAGSETLILGVAHGLTNSKRICVLSPISIWCKTSFAYPDSNEKNIYYVKCVVKSR